MSLDSLIEEIQRRSQVELGDLLAKASAEEARIATERDRRIQEIRTEQERGTQLDVARDRAQRIAAAKLAARKKVYGAQEERLHRLIEGAQGVLREFTGSEEYTDTLRRMVASAVEAFGKQVRISGRSEDANRLGKLAGKSFEPTARPILGGIIAETPDGKRRLDLSFDEMIRLREDRVREILT
jgi:vacuolar-type H+-ATPase subunit E/Vma4